MDDLNGSSLTIGGIPDPFAVNRIHGRSGPLAVGSFTSNHGLTSTNDLGVAGKFECDGDAFFDGNINVAGGVELSEVVYRTDSINLLSAGATTLVTVPAGKTFIVNRVVLLKSVANANSGTPTFSIGGNASNYDDYLLSANLTSSELDSSNEIMTFLPVVDDGAKKCYPTAADIKFNLTTAGGGSSWSINVFVFGYLFVA